MDFHCFQVCDKRQIVREKKTEYIHREKDILKTITDKWDEKFPYFVRLYATFHVSDAIFLYLLLNIYILRNKNQVLIL